MQKYLNERAHPGSTHQDIWRDLPICEIHGFERPKRRSLRVSSKLKWRTDRIFADNNRKDGQGVNRDRRLLALTGSKNELQRELELPREPRRGNLPGRLTVVASLENDIVRVNEIGVIENIEGLHPELHIQSLADSKPLAMKLERGNGLA